MIDSVSETAGATADLKKARRQKPAIRNPQSTIDRLPPHALDMEQGVLGCQLLSPNDCVGEVIEKLKDIGVEAHYDLRHQTIQAELFEMYDNRIPIDVVTLQQRLKDKQLLEQIGGIAYLAQLQDAVPSAANLSYYLDIVREKFLLRKMIQTCTDVVGRVYDYEGEVDALLDEVERDVLRISESRAQSDVLTTKDLVNKAIGTIENFFSRKGTLTGPGHGLCGFGPDDGRSAWQRDDRHRGAAEHGQDFTGDEHRGTRGPGAKVAGGRVQPGNERGSAGVAHDVFHRPGEFAEHPRGVHERIGLPQTDQRGRQTGERQAVD